jgi:hypothetical protein
MRKVETTSDVFNLIDLFSDSKAKAAINGALVEDIFVNYSSNYFESKPINEE